MNVPPRTEERTPGHALTDVSFGIEYASLNERFWSTVNTTMNILQILAGFLALAGALDPSDGWGKRAVIALAVLSALQLTLDPVRRSISYRDVRMHFHDLKKRLPGMSLGEIDFTLEDIRKAAPTANRYLIVPAQNNVLRSLGHEADRLSPLEWVFNFVS